MPHFPKQSRNLLCFLFYLLFLVCRIIGSGGYKYFFVDVTKWSSSWTLTFFFVVRVGFGEGGGGWRVVRKNNKSLRLLLASFSIGKLSRYTFISARSIWYPGICLHGIWNRTITKTPSTINNWWYHVSCSTIFIIISECLLIVRCDGTALLAKSIIHYVILIAIIWVSNSRPVLI